MTAIKEKIIGAITIMSDGDAQQLWESIQKDYIAKKKNWDDIEDDIPTPEEKQILHAYKHNEPQFQPHMTQEEVLQELGLK